MSVSIRNERGQSLVVLTLFIAFLVVLAAGLFSFELNRAEVARQQLRTATEAAALAGAATLASQDNTDPAKAQDQAIQTALNSFKQNSIIGKSLGNAVLAYITPDNPQSDDSSIYVELLDPNNNNQPVPIGDPRGKTIRVTSAFGLRPAFGAYLNIGTETLRCIASGGVPELDIALCFDVSASIDDQTPVTFVKRVWNATKGKTDYVVAQTTNGSPAGPLAQGRIFDIIQPPAVGSAVDGLPPQNLSDSNYPGKNKCPIKFSEQGAARGLRGSSNAGSPPGNFPGRGAGTGDPYTYTDVVVNIDGLNTFGGTSYGGYNFPDLATLVEASRGNLENQTVFVNSKASLSVPSNVLPKPGYQSQYVQLAAQNLHPLRDAQDACQTFLTIMNTDADAHFSLIAFTSNAGKASTTTYNADNVDYTYPQAGSGKFPVPLITLNPAPTQTNYSTVYNVLPTTTATSGTNIGDAISTAVGQLTANGRKGAKKAIVLFTDGEPTVGGPLNGDPWTNARLAAAQANKAGIPIYAIGLAQTPAIIPSETAILTDQNSNASTGGVAGIAGHGGKFFLVTNNADLRKTFENIARQLVQLVRD